MLPAIETTLARLGAGPAHPRELNGLLSQHRDEFVCDCRSRTPEEMDQIRRELAWKIDGLLREPPA